MIGQVVGQYKIIEKLGEGGMGAVYKGVDLMVEREVAIKMLRPEIARQPELVERFRSEAITLAKLNSPGIATLYNFFRQGDDFFMVMEFVSGRTLETVIRECGAMQWDRAVTVFCCILEAIQPAHQAGILHRDIKPSNIMLTSWGGVKVMDFGIARVLGSARMTREGRMVGTIEYIAPERIKGSEADTRADIYSLGVVLYEMLTGRLPFESDSEFEIMRGHMQDAPPPMLKFGPNVPPAVESVVMMSLAKSADQRIQSCAAFLLDLQNATQGLVPIRTSAVYAAAQTIHAQPQQTGPSATIGIIYPNERRTPPPATSFASPAALNTAEARATRFEPAPQQFATAAVPMIQMPPTGTAPSPSAPVHPAGFLAQLNWKHYAAAAAVVAIIVLAAVAMNGRQKTDAAAPQPAAITQPAVSNSPPASTPSVNPSFAPVTSEPAAATLPAAVPPAGGALVEAPVTPMVTDAAEDTAKEQARREARARANARKKDALKALDEQ